MGTGEWLIQSLPSPLPVAPGWGPVLGLHGPSQILLLVRVGPPAAGCPANPREPFGLVLFTEPHLTGPQGEDSGSLFSLLLLVMKTLRGGQGIAVL